MKKVNSLSTESPSYYNDLENKSVAQILCEINAEDKTVALAVERKLGQITALVESIVPRLLGGGRVFYIGAGTSGRLGILDASECPPTYGVPAGLIVGLIAGGDIAIKKAVENAEDDLNQASKDLLAYDLKAEDTVIGIAASGRTPYVIGGLKFANSIGALTGCVVCNTGSLVAKEAQFPVEVEVGPEYVTGSTRMKSGTAQKMVLNMISTSLMIKLGRVKGNKMVDMQLSNEKLRDRGVQMLMDETNLDYEAAQNLLTESGSVRLAIIKHHNDGLV
jgi:N-acetylmuramic acid 6-phosphate etherase